MARRKRASMREGPLADLFRSTIHREQDEPEREQPTEQTSAVPPPSSEETTVVPEREPSPPPSPAPEPPPAREEPEPSPPDPERVRAYRVEEHAALPAAKERSPASSPTRRTTSRGPPTGAMSPGWPTITARRGHTFP